MSTSAVASRYAKALFELANDKGVVEQVDQELKDVESVFQSVPDLHKVMAHPRMSLEQKHDLLKKGFSSMHTLVLNTLFVLVDRDRIDTIHALADEFQKLADDEFHIARAEVRAVRPLTDREKEEVARQFSKKVNNRQVLVSDVQDESLIGGVIVQIGDYVYDGSVQSMLHRMERKIVSANR